MPSCLLANFEHESNLFALLNLNHHLLGALARMPRDVRQRVEVTDEEDEEVRRDVMTDGDEDSARAKEPGVEDDKNEVDDEVDDEEVYEIESIIHHKFRMFVSPPLFNHPARSAVLRKAGLRASLPATT